MHNQLFGILVFYVVALAFTGCSRTAVPEKNNKVTKANYDQIKNGMSMKEVEVVLGDAWKTTLPDDAEEFVTLDNVRVSAIYEWNSGLEAETRMIEIGFKDGKVAAKTQTGL